MSESSDARWASLVEGAHYHVTTLVLGLVQPIVTSLMVGYVSFTSGSVHLVLPSHAQTSRVHRWVPSAAPGGATSPSPQRPGSGGVSWPGGSSGKGGVVGGGGGGSTSVTSDTSQVSGGASCVVSASPRRGLQLHDLQEPVEKLVESRPRTRIAPLVHLGEQSRPHLLGRPGRRGAGRNRLHEVVLFLRHRVDTRVHPHPQ